MRSLQIYFAQIATAKSTEEANDTYGGVNWGSRREAEQIRCAGVTRYVL
jgi:hypothetical protein